MGAARYVGRVGTLAVALGIGAAIANGQGVAWASPASTGSSSQGSDAPSTSGSTTGGSANAGDSSGNSDGSSKADANGPANTDTGAPTTSAGVDDSASDVDDSASDAKGSSNEDGSTTKDSSSQGVDTSKGDMTPRHSRLRSNVSSSLARSGATSSSSSSTTTAAGDNRTDTQNSTSADDRVVQSLTTTQDSPSTQRAAVEDSTTPVLTSLSASNAQHLVVSPTVMSLPAPPAPSPLVSMVSVATAAISGILDPFAGTSPTTPSQDSPLSWLTLAAARREIGTASPTVAAATGPIVYVPNALVVTDPTSPLAGVISNSVQGTDASGLPLAYTVLSQPSAGGKVNLDPTTGAFQFLPDSSDFTSATPTETFTILVHEVTPFVAALTPLTDIPLLGTFVNDGLTLLYQVPILNDVLAPIIGNSIVTPVSINVDDVNPTGNPIAFTTTVISQDGTPISTNFFPALGLQTGKQAPTILNGPGLGSAGNIDPTSTISLLTGIPGLAPFRAAGYNIVTWDPRGEFDSGGRLELDNPAYEGQDVKAIISWVATQPETQLDGTGDPRMGMIGGSYGGGIQLVTAVIDPRVDAIVPTIAWNSLTSSLYPKQTFKTAWGTLLLLDLVEAGARINPQIYTGIVLGDALGILAPSDVALLDASGPAGLVGGITAPTLLIQGTADGLFPLQEAITNAQLLTAAGTPVKMVWFCGGHGVCLDPGVDLLAQANALQTDQLAWLQQYVKEVGTPADDLPNFTWIDQLGETYSSDLMPFNPDFRGTAITAAGPGGFLPIVPLTGGSGPAANLPAAVPALLSIALAAKASNAINLDVPVAEGTQLVGAPELTFTYSGLGTTHALYAQIVDEDSGRVLGNLATPIPVTLDGFSHKVSVAEGQLASIAYTAPEGGGHLTLQLVASATQYENVTSVGAINVSDMTVSLPTVGDGFATPQSISAAGLTTVA